MKSIMGRWFSRIRCRDLILSLTAVQCGAPSARAKGPLSKLLNRQCYNSLREDMFTTECPKCGREIDVSETDCSYCGSGAKAQTADRPAPAPAAQRVPRSRPVQRVRRARRKSAAWSIPPLYLTILAGFFVVTIGVIVYFTSPGLFGGGGQKLTLENVGDASEYSGVSSASVGDLEVAGVRTWWDQEREKLKVRAVVVNHGDIPTNQVDLKVHLKSRNSRASASPLASFDLRLDEELGPLQSRDIEADLASLAHPSALPPWNEIRIELEEQ